MSTSLLETARLLLESCDAHENTIVSQLNEKPNGHLAKVTQQHNIAKLIEDIAKENKEVRSILEDKDGILAKDIQAMKGPNMFNSFYSSIAKTREYYLRFPHLNVEASQTNVFFQESSIQFSGEEVFGKYLDLHSFHLQFSNLPNMPAHDHDYLQYLDKFNTFFYIPENCKTTKQYRSYIMELWAYLSYFFSRIQPLVDQQTFISTWKVEFDEKWSTGKFPGWKKKAPSNSEAQPLRLGMFNTVEELEALGLDRLKQGLEALGLKCGGTLRDRAERLWSIRGKKLEDIPAKLKAPIKKAQDGTETDMNIYKQV